MYENNIDSIKCVYRVRIPLEMRINKYIILVCFPKN